MLRYFLFFFIFGNLIIFFVCFRNGINVTPDSIQYIGAAKYLSNFKGFRNPITDWYITEESTPMTHWPPFYPLVLSVFFLFKIPSFFVPILLNMFLFGLFLFLSFSLMFEITRNLKYSLLFGIFFLLSYPIIEIYTFAWSEPLFMVLLILQIIALNEYFKGDDIFKYVIIPISMLLSLTRFIGVSFIFATFLILFFINKKFSFFYLITSLLPISIFLIYTSFITKGIADRKFSYIPGFYSKLEELPKTLSELFFSSLISTKLGFIFIAFIFLIAILMFLKKRKIISKILLIYSTIYLIFLILSMLFFDPGILFDKRFLFPLFVLITIFIFYELSQIKFSYILLIVLTIISLIKDIQELPSISKEGHKWSYSNKNACLKICDFIKNKKIKGLLYSNYPDAVYFFTGKPAKILVSKFYPNPLQRFSEICKEYKIFIVYIKKYPEKIYLYKLDEILTVSKFKKVYETEDGIFYEEIE